MGAKDAKETVGNIKSFSLEGSSGDEYFDKRIKLSSAGVEVGMEWIMPRLKSQWKDGLHSITLETAAFPKRLRELEQLGNARRTQ
ncbi:unnamed protein product [Ectocarpus sp. 4 AP-2014]